MSMACSYLQWRSSATNRRTPQTAHNPNSFGPQRQVINHVPTPQPIFQFIAFGLIIFLAFLQFLPATHFRDPSDPFRNWVPVQSNPSLRASSDENSSGGENELLHIVSWMDCLDLRLLAVLANSTLSASRYPDLVRFHFFIPKGDEDKVSFFKLKVLFPHSNLEIHGQEEVKEVIRTAFSGINHSIFNYEEIAPFVIPSVHQFLSKFTYLSPNVIVKGRVEELIGVDLSSYAIAVAEDCCNRLNSYVNWDVLDAIQRSASKPWVSETIYAKNSCMLDLSVLLIDARKLENDFLEAFLWWSKVLNLSERSRGRNPATALALYNRYLKLSSSWLVKKSTSVLVTDSLIVLYDGPKTVCSEFGDGAALQTEHGNFWMEYLPPMSDRILGS
ncbi:hypothetical protein ACOSP7_013092 [Xanthoceras sorbifolium]|uniref:Hexosyltransferase n=1 Tax=Xanthoceras sorbifolium TaxID=99658 RepID=A0ABQ8HYZ2_9ROSI|nr:hypothetical protein JRO89_XS06G0199400 [Xanthoceras sorbifolium]